MLRNYLKIAFRNLVKHKIYAFINVTGLAIGMACCFLLFLFVWNEWSYDGFHEDADRIHRLSIELRQSDGSLEYQNMMYPTFRDELVEAYPAIQKATRLVQAEVDFKVDTDFFRYDLAEVDAPFFEMFSFPLLAGEPSTVLQDRNSIVLTDEVATAFFDLEPGRFDQAIGRTVSAVGGDQTYDFTVTGVAKRFPGNSSIQFDAAISFENYDPIRLGGNNWGGRASTYVLLPEGQTAESMERSLAPFVGTQFANYYQNLRDNEMLAQDPDAAAMRLQPLRQMHREPDVWTPYETNPFDPQYGFILAGIALLVLLIACINFMTLSIGRSASRTREVGMRKALGAFRSQLMNQFWGEAILMTAISLAIGFLLTWLALPYFNNLTDQSLSLSMVSSTALAATLLIVLVVVGAVAGGYPALVLSRFQPAKVLRGQSQKTGQQGLTRTLVVLQYTISIALIVGTLVMSKQLTYLVEKDLGFDDELVMVVETRQLGRSEAPIVLNRLKEQLLPYDQVTHIARTGSSFNRGHDRNTWTDENGISRSAYNFGVGYDYIDLMGMEVVAGRNFSPEHPSDSTRSILVNEALVREFGLEDPVGHTLHGWLSWVYEESPVIIGVVKDFNFRSLREEIAPAVMNMHPEYYNYMNAVLVKVKPNRLRETVSTVENAWLEAIPGRPFSYSFLDDDLAMAYVNEQRWTDIVTWSSAIAILIACLGLFGLATLSIVRRTKEIGIRKVLGASVAGVVELVTREFVVLIAIAAVFALPIAWYGMRGWLDGFAYRVDMGFGAFLIAPVVAVAIAFVAISYHAIRAATADPVKALRYE
jgi:putative ABC transport system permease protein